MWQNYLAFDAQVRELKEQNNINFHCDKEHCSECCNDYFYISAVEYYLIKNHIIETKGVKKFNDIKDKSVELFFAFKDKYPDEDKRLEMPSKGGIPSMYDDKKHLDRFLPCPLLGADGRCECYPARTLICRFIGTSYLYLPCRKIEKYLQDDPIKEIKDIMLPIAYSDETYKHNVDYFDTANNNVIVQRPYPLFHFFAYDELFEKAYLAATQENLEQYAKSLC